MKPGGAAFFALGFLAVSGTALASPHPTLVWTRTHNSAANDDDRIYGVAMAASGSVYAAGSEKRGDLGPGQMDNWMVRKYGLAGDVLWDNRYNGSANGNDRAMAVVVDAGGNAVAAGFETSTGPQGEDILVRKYSGDGAILWGVPWNDSDDDDDEAFAVALDASSNVYVAGYAGLAAVVLKYDSLGNLQWSRTCRAAGSAFEEYYAAEFDPAGNLVVAGLADNGTDTDWLIRQYDSAGNEGWTVIIGGTGDDYANAVAPASPGGVYVAGIDSHISSGQGLDWGIRKLGPSGGLDWERFYDGASHNNDFANSVSPDYGSGVVVAGDSEGFLLLGKYGPDGGLGWTAEHSNPLSSLDTPNSIAIRGPYLVVGGAELRTDLSESYNWLLLRYGYFFDAQLSGSGAHPGESLSVVLSVTNVGDAVMKATSASLAVTAGASLASLVSGPSGPADLGAGATRHFTWTFLAKGEGTMSFLAGVSGTGFGTGVTAYESSGVSVAIVDRPAATLWLDGPGAALDRNVFRPNAGERLLVRVNPPDKGDVSVKVFTASGLLVRTLPLKRDSIGGGQFVLEWDGKADGGSAVQRGVYLIAVEGGGLKKVLKVIVK